MEQIVSFIVDGGIVSIIVFLWLSLYFMLTIWIYFSKTLTINALEKIEQKSLTKLLKGDGSIDKDSALFKCVRGEDTIKLLPVCKSFAEINATKGLSTLSIISSTSPFIGLFGTIVSILKTFSKLGDAGSVSLNVIAPAISEALVATAVGIFVAIPAYSIHLILKRKAYEYISLIQREIDILKLKSFY